MSVDLGNLKKYSIEQLEEAIQVCNRRIKEFVETRPIEIPHELMIERDFLKRHLEERKKEIRDVGLFH